MKRINLSIILALLIATSNARPVSALMLDFGALAGVISRTVGTSSETANKVIEQVNQIKQMAAQGFSFDQLKGMALQYAYQYGQQFANDLLQSHKNQRTQGRVGDTKQKNLDVLEAQMELYSSGVKLMYDIKLQSADNDIAQAKKDLQKAKMELSEVSDQLPIRKNEYDAAIASGDAEKIRLAGIAYDETRSRYFALVNQVASLEASISELEEARELLYQKSQIVGTEEDEQYKDFQNRVAAMEATDDETELVQPEDPSEDEHWGSMKDMDKYKLTQEDYVKFIENYFYDESDISFSAASEEAARQKRITEQAKKDVVDRNTRYLLINTAVHLLQVSTSVRREIPQRLSQADEMFQQTKKGSGELESMMAYASSDVEKIKALWLYAKLLSAKLQYMAAHDLSRIDKKKSIKDANGTVIKKYEDFDLEKYILTDDYVIEINRRSNQTLGLDERKAPGEE